MTPELLEKVQNNPQLFLEAVLGCNSMQDYHLRICGSIAVYDRVAISACHAVGKTWILARIVLWFLYSYPNSIIITTAPTTRQVEKLLWGEIGVAYEKALYNLGGHLTNRELKIAKKWYAMGFSPKKAAGADEQGEQKDSTFQGWHADYVLIVFDEAVGVPPDIWTQVEGLLTSGKVVKFICIANPTTKNCNFYDLFQMPSWHKIHLSCFDSPNLIANGITCLEDIKQEVETLTNMEEGERLDRIKHYKKPVTYLISCQWVMEKAMEWGFNDARFIGKVLGQFPDTDDSSLIQLAHVKKAQARNQITKEKGTRYIGIDVARYGDDKTVFTELIEGDKVGPVHTRTLKTSKKDLMETVGQSVRFIMDDYQGETVIVCIDATGMGSGVYDRLAEIQKYGKAQIDGEELRIKIPNNIKFIELHYGNSVKVIQKNKTPTKKEELEQKTHHNIKSLMYEDLSQALKNDLRLRKDNTYNQQLPTIKYTFTSSGKQIVESKKDYKKRTGKSSPDESDSLAQANFARRFESSSNYLRKLVGGKK